ncbi:MAG: cation diffusion facilitator family transporter [Thermodesulfovibrionales bacterium]
MDRTDAVRSVLIYTLIANTAVAVAKMIYGYFSNSIAMVSDGFHSLFDGVSNVIGLVGVWIASHPPDRDHPYGHKKYETLFTIAIAIMIFLTCLQILKKVYESFLEDHRVAVTSFSFLVMAITMAVNVAVAVYETKKGKELKSDFLIADARHTKSDILASVAVIVGLIFSLFGYQRVDAVVGIIITILVARIGYGILKAASDILVDTVCIDTSAIGDVVNLVEGVKGCHDIRTRGTESSVFLDLHILVDPSISVEKSHEIADEVESKIKDRFPSVVDIVVHIEPEEK